MGLFLAAIIVRHMVHAVKGIDIAEPALMPALVVSAVSSLLSRRVAPPLAYVSGSLGTLIGVDLLNLGKIEGLSASIASIGGAGTFDGIFLTGILVALLAGPFAGKERAACLR